MARRSRILAWAAVGAAAFTVYGSLVPFHFRSLTLGEAFTAFGATLTTSPGIASRSDAAANVLLGVPLGFALLGLVSVGRLWSRRKLIAGGLFLLPMCVLFAVCVEFSQLFTESRTCSASDIAAQTLGAVAGMVAWVLRGERLTERAEAIWDRADLNAVGRLLVAYAAFLVFVQTLPFDVSASPTNLYRKFRDGGVHFSPFGEFDGANDTERWALFAKFAKLAGLYLPVGLLASRLKGRIESWSIIRVALAALALGVALETPQLVVQSRTPSATDAIVGAIAVMVGWYAGRVHHEGLAIPFAVSWGIVWLAALTPVTQPPPGTLKLQTPRPFDWWPGMPLESGDPLNALEEILTKLVLFGLLGVLVAAWRLPPRTRRSPGGSVSVTVVVATTLGLLAAGTFEASQRWYNTHTPGVTDVLLGGLGGALGVLVASRVNERGGISPR